VFLARENLLETLREGVDEVVVPEPVLTEIRAHGSDDPTVKALSEVTWLNEVPAPDVPPEVAVWELGPGETAVLALALAEKGSWAVIDDRDARRCARSLSIPLVGTLGLVLVARRLGWIAAARPVVERLRDSGMYLTDQVIKDALAIVGE
jgi:predicted nucleic acid-binding protein